MNVGDIVQLKRGYLPMVGDPKGELGIVTKIAEFDQVGIEWHNLKRGHACDGTCTAPKGWFVDHVQLKVIESTEFPF